MYISEILSDFAVDLRFSKLSKDIIEKTKITLMDTLGVMLGGVATRTGKNIIDFTSNLGDREESTIIGTNKRTSRQNAAFANASNVEILELSDGHRWSGTHPSSIIPAAVLALGECRGASGRDILASIILGYDVMGRIGKAIRLSSSPRLKGNVISTGTIGAFGAAIAASKILDLDSSKMADSLGIAGFLTPLSMRENYDGQLVKPIHAGQSAKAGVLSAMLAEANFGGSHEIVERFCDVFSDDINKSLITEELGEYFVISDLYYKKHASCRFSHAAVDATLYLMEYHDINPDQVERVVVKTFKVAVRALNQYTNKESTFVTCQFSLPYLLSLAILSGEVIPQQFSEERIKDRTLHEFAKKVKVVEDEGITNLFPDKYAAKVEIQLTTGKKQSKFIGTPKGDPGNPLTVREFKEKFASLAIPVIHEERTEKIINDIFKLEHLNDISELLKYLKPSK